MVESSVLLPKLSSAESIPFCFVKVRVDLQGVAHALFIPARRFSFIGSVAQIMMSCTLSTRSSREPKTRAPPQTGWGFAEKPQGPLGWATAAAATAGGGP